MASVDFTGPNGSDPVAAIRQLRATALPAESDVLAALDNQRDRIVKRTEAGTDSIGARFAPYSERYAKRKGRNTVDLGGADGRLLGSMVPVMAGFEASQEIALSIPGEEDAMIARVHNEGATIRTRLGTGKGKPKKNGKATFTIPARHFFDASPEDLTAMERDIGSRVDARLNRTP